VRYVACLDTQEAMSSREDPYIAAMRTSTTGIDLCSGVAEDVRIIEIIKGIIEVGRADKEGPLRRLASPLSMLAFSSYIALAFSGSRRSHR